MRLIIRYFFKLIRLLLGPFMLLGNALTSPRGIVRSAEAQQAVDLRTRQLTLYHYATCPFCIKVRRAIKRLSLKIELCNAQHDTLCRHALLQGGGTLKVPCLRIQQDNGDIHWMYESADIVHYLEQAFSGPDETLTQAAVTDQPISK